MGLTAQAYDAIINLLVDDKYDVHKMVLISIALIWFIYKLINYYWNLPPGPWGYPIIGSLPILQEPPSPDHYLEIAKEYGDIFSVTMGSTLIVCISSAKLLKEVFNRQDSTGRPHTPLNNLLGGFGIVLSEGALWKKQRQFLYEKFRALGVKLCAYPRFEKYILMEIDDLSRILKEKYDGVPVDPSQLLGRHVHNVILQLMMNFRFQEHDEEFKVFNKRVNDGMNLFGSVIMGEFIKYYYEIIPGKKHIIEEVRRNLNDVSKFHTEHIAIRTKQRQAIAARNEPADLLDYYLEAIENENENGKNENTIFPKTDPAKQVVQVMNDLFSAGMETARTTLIWTLVILMREQEVAEKARAELKQVVNVGDLVTLELRPKLAYIEAIIFETLRRVGVVPLGTTHLNNSTWKIGDYIIPEGTRIIPLLSKMGLDPEVYPEPLKFKPERFLKDGKLYIPDSFVQFGTGQRMCLGSQLARMELFLFLSNLINSFDFYMPEGEPIPALKGNMATTHSPIPFELCFKKRVE